MSLPFLKDGTGGDDEPLVGQKRQSKTWAKKWRGIEFFIRLRSHKVTKVVHTQVVREMKEALRIAAPGAAAPDPPPTPPTDQTQTTDKTWVIACGMMPPNDPGPQ